MNWLRSPLAASLLGLFSAPALAISPAASLSAVNPIKTAKPFGPGSPGFLPTCSSQFAVANWLTQSNAFTTAPWAGGNAGGTTPTVATNAAIVDPAGGHNAWMMTLAAFNATTGNFENVSNAASTYLASAPNTFDIYVQGKAGNLFSISETANGTTYDVSTTVTLNGKWQRLAITFTPSAGGTRYWVLGPDLRDPVQATAYKAVYGSGGSIPAQSVNIAFAQGVVGATELPYTPTTTTNANSVAVASNAYVTVTNVPCPPGVAFRDFTGMRFAGFNLLQGNVSGSPTTGNLGYGGVGPAMVTNYQTHVNGVWYGLANCIVGAHNATPYPWGQCLYSTPDLITSPWTWLGAAVTPGASTPLTTYILHSAQLDSGCTVSATFYKYCFLMSGETNGTLNTGTVSVAYTNSITTLPYSVLSASVINNTAMNNNSQAYRWVNNGLGGVGTTNPTIVGCLTVSATYYCATSVNDNGGNFSLLYTFAPSTDLSNAGAILSYDVAIRPPIGTDWDAGASLFDNHVYYNSHGFYEYFYTAYKSGTQYIAYAVSNKITGPWWKQNACAIGSNNPGCVIYKCAPTATACSSPTQPIWGGTTNIGDTTAFTQRGLFMLGGNFDSGSTASAGYLNLMPNR